MITRRYSLKIRGRTKEWSIEVDANPDWVKSWRDDGITVDRMINKIPEWWVTVGLPVKLYCFFQDLLNLKLPFRKD